MALAGMATSAKFDERIMPVLNHIRTPRNCLEGSTSRRLRSYAIGRLTLTSARGNPLSATALVKENSDGFKMEKKSTRKRTWVPDQAVRRTIEETRAVFVEETKARCSVDPGAIKTSEKWS